MLLILNVNKIYQANQKGKTDEIIYFEHIYEIFRC